MKNSAQYTRIVVPGQFQHGSNFAGGPLIETLFGSPRSDRQRENKPRRFLRWATLPPSRKEIAL